MDLSTFIPSIAAHLHIAPAQLVFYVLCINVGSRVLARRIPDNATGFWGFVRQTAAIFGAEVSSKITPDATVADVARAALQTPPIPQRVAANEAGDTARPQV